jgi:hypothetical protein
MFFQGKAAEAANEILSTFRNPNSLPAPLAQVFIHRKDNVPCRSWSWRNQLIVALHGHADARGFRQWEQVGRHVRKGEKAFYILSPCVKTVVSQETGEAKKLLYGFRGTPVFGLDQTQGQPLPPRGPALDAWLKSLPLWEVVDAWGLGVEAFNGRRAGYLGRISHGHGIALGVKNLSTWAHELVHAADRRNGRLKELGQHWRNETVAELGGAVLLKVLGYEHEADLGGCWQYVEGYAKTQGIDVLKACSIVLERTCEAVALILDTAEEIRADKLDEAAASF